MTAVLLIDQAGLPAGVSGFARTDGLDTGALVTVQSVGMATSHEARILTLPSLDTTALGTFVQTSPSPPTWTFSPLAGVDGMYRVELVTDRGLPSEDRQVRVFGIRNGVGLLFPSFGLVADPLANAPDLADAQKLLGFVQACELNEPRAGFLNGYPFGYQAEMDLILRSNFGPPQVVQAEVFTDFITGIDGAFWDDTNSSGTGSAGGVPAGNANADEGLGIVAVDSGAGIGIGRLEHGVAGVIIPLFRGSLATVAELRVKLPANPGDITFGWGFDDGAGSSCKMAYNEGVGTWIALAESQAGGASDPDITAIAAVGGWRTLRIEWDPGVEARFYVDGALISTLATATAIPQSTDQMTVYIEALTVGATSGAVYADWFRATVQRA